MKRLVPLVLVAGLHRAAIAQTDVLPDAPVAAAPLPDTHADRTVRTWALNWSTVAKYSATRSTWDCVEGIGIDWRFPNPRYRVSLGYTHTALSGENSIAAGVNVKLAEWGDR